MAERATTAEQDLDIICRISAGDCLAFRTLVERYQGPLYTFVLRMVRRPPVAEELVQETLVRVFQAAPRFKSRAAVSTWLFHIAARLALNEAARAHHRHEVAGEIPEARSETHGPFEEIERKELSRIIEKALDQLPPNQRAAVILARFEGMPYREIGEVLGVSEGAVDSLLQRARQKLAQLLGPIL